MANGNKSTNNTHERSDVSIRLLAWFLVGLAVSAVIIHITLAFLWRYFERADPTPSVSRWVGPRLLPPSPRLQTAPEVDMEVYLKNQRRWLSTYGWLDQRNGIVRVPIDRALEMIVKDGLPHRPPADIPPPVPLETYRGLKNEPSANY